MAALIMQRDLVIEMKKETILNVGILSKLQGMPQDVARQVLKENALDKPTQSLFNQLSYYLVRIIDPKASESLSWPLYDSKTERIYRNDLANFISQCSNKGLLAPVMTSYLVNPGCFKVTWLIYQMSQLALQRVLESKMKKDSQKKRYSDMTEKYKKQEKEKFIEEIENETLTILSKFSNCQYKRRAMEKIAEKFRTKITKMESKLASLDAQKFLNNIVDQFLSKHKLDKIQIEDISKVKDVMKSAPFFDRWLSNVDTQLDAMESEWNKKMMPFLDICKETSSHTESLIARHTGEADRDSYMIEYNHHTDEINTTDLQNQVNSEQKYVLKNLVKEEKLSFPNLIRSFLIAISFILKGERFGEEIYEFNEYLESGEKSFREVVAAMQDIMRRVMDAQAKLQPSPMIQPMALPAQDIPDIPPLPDLSSIFTTRDFHHQLVFDSFTPLSMSKHQFNLQRRTTLHTFVKPQPKMFLTSFSQGPREDFFKSIQSGRVSTHDQLNSTQNFNNISIIPQNNRANETIAGFATGCTKQQLLRLLSTKKSSSSKKFKHTVDRQNIKFKKGALFNESTSSNESSGLFRSYSSPNLYENREPRSVQRSGRRKLSVMQESGSPLLEVSGITALDKDSSCEKSQPIVDSCRITETNTIPAITLTPVKDKKFHPMLKDFQLDLNNEFLTVDPPKRPSIEATKRISKEYDSANVTPQNNSKLIQKTSSLEKIINRYKKVRANVLHENENKSNDFLTIVEEKENMFTANRILLPDLLSPSCSVLNKKPEGNLEIEMDSNVRRKPRESLGTMLDVDHTFLDQFDLIE